MPIEVKIVDPIENFEQAVPLFQASWAETGFPFPFVPEDAKKFYSHVASLGMLFAAGAYDGDELVGYCIITIVPHPFNHSIRICNADGLFIFPDYRKGRVLASLMEAARIIGRKYGAHSVHWHAQANTEFARMLPSRFENISNYYREIL